MGRQSLLLAADDLTPPRRHATPATPPSRLSGVNPSHHSCLLSLRICVHLWSRKSAFRDRGGSAMTHLVAMFLAAVAVGVEPETAKPGDKMIDDYLQRLTREQSEKFLDGATTRA